MLIVGTALGVGILIGAAAAMQLRNVGREILEREHEEIVIEQGKEIARLRTQVALHINKEKE